ncbi:hypothetical protein JVU11DRAFT_8874 [Chiua virens]|nr:hypothetical protein JVU11DRAFT_8874 [Chiua virens]
MQWSKQKNAGQGEYYSQLERVSAVIETPHQPPRWHLDLPNDEPVNPMAPTPHPQMKASCHSVLSCCG